MENLLKLIDFLPVGLCTTEDRIITACNQNFAEMFLADKEALNGRSLSLLYASKLDSDRISRLMYSNLKKFKINADKRIMCRSDSSLFWCNVIGKAINPEKPVSSAIWVFNDLSNECPLDVYLTSAERIVATLMVAGTSNKIIAESLGISQRTVEGHCLKIAKKLQTSSRSETCLKLANIITIAEAK